MTNYIEGFTAPVVMNARSTALVIVDMQYASGSRDHGLGKVLAQQGQLESASYRFGRIDEMLIPNISRLLHAFRNLNAHVVHLTVGCKQSDFSDAPRHMRPFFEATNNHAGTREHEIVDALKPLPGEPVFNKVTMGGFASTGLGAHLVSKGISEIIVTGVSTNNCVGMTGMEAADRGFGVVLASDGSGTCSERMQSAFEDTFKRLWGRVASTDEIIAEIEASAQKSAVA
jgi:nicotinamidase-related amidase